MVLARDVDFLSLQILPKTDAVNLKKKNSHKIT